MPYLSEIERGQKEASSEILAAICDALRIELPDLLDEVGRELIRADQAAQPSVIRLDAIRAARARAQTQLNTPSVAPNPRGPSDPGDVMCLAA